MRALYVFVSARSRGAPLEVRINDIPVLRFSTPNAMSGTSPVVYYATKGANSVQGRLGQFETAEPPPAAFIRVAEYQEGDLVETGSGVSLAEIALDAANPSPPPASFSLADAPDSWDWQTFDLLGPESMAPAQAFADRISEAWAQSDPAPILAATNWRLQDVPRAFPHRTPDEVRTLMSRAVLESENGIVPSRVFSPILCGGGRLLDCLTDDGTPYAVKVAADGEPQYFPMIIGRKSGNWGIVR